MKVSLILSVVLLGFAAVTAQAGGFAAERMAQNMPAPDASPYLPRSPVWGSPYVSGPVIGGVFYDGPSDESVGARLFTPAPGVSCSLRRHACWTRTGIDRTWTARFFGIRS